MPSQVATQPGPLWSAVLLFLSATLIVYARSLKTLVAFVYSCFLKPLGRTSTQQGRLNAFYQSQAGIYDYTRSRLLKGREDMLRIAAAHLKYQDEADPQGEQPGLVWIDVGGGTGWNIEIMDKYYPIARFRAVYLIDLCEPLLEVARQRFARLGYTNVHVLCQDATNFTLPLLPDGNVVESLDLVTMSYSLSMIPGYYAMLDRLSAFLSHRGLLGCVDFYVSDKTSRGPVTDCAGDIARHCSWLVRSFWTAWFDFDHVNLHHSRRAYLEHRFGTIKSINGRNTFTPLVSIPYYIWLGCRSHDGRSLFSYDTVSKRIGVFGDDPLTPLYSPTLSVTTSSSMHSDVSDYIPDFSLSPALSATSSATSVSSMKSAGAEQKQRQSPRSPSSSLLKLVQSSRDVAVAAAPPMSTFYYQPNSYRLPYSHGKEQEQFRSWIYGFTWEDPYDDCAKMGITKDSTVMCITSAGDNALHYVADKGCKTVHCVDMNPCQGHLLELKLAGIQSLGYEEFWQLFGEGCCPSFEVLLDTKLSPYLSAHAYAFWKNNKDAFSHRFYAKGYSGWALRILSAIFTVLGKSSTLEAFANAPTLEDQVKIYEKSIRPVLLSGWLVRCVLSNPLFLWNALGVPMAQLSMITSESSVRQYVVDTLDPIGYKQHVRTQNYHYYLSTTMRHNPDNPPLYLTREGFEKLRAGRAVPGGHSLINAFRLHTDSLLNVLSTTVLIPRESIDTFIIMDHQDWYNSSSNESRADLDKMIQSVKRSIAIGGKVFWRSAAMKPWYTHLWELNGFRVARLSKRKIGAEYPIDSVNMYASLWQAVKA